jgi:ubiquitin-like protein Pup
MAETARVHRPLSQAEAEAVAAVDAEKVAATAAHGKEVVDDIDALLDEIDEVLEENADAFVRNFRQQPGQ